jgi:hypothetical protein
MEATVQRPTQFTARDRQWIRGIRDGLNGRPESPPADPDLAISYLTAYATAAGPTRPHYVGIATIDPRSRN